MEYRRFGNKIVLRLDAGDEITNAVLQTAAREKIKLASLTGIGGTDDALIGVFDMNKKAYNRYSVTGTHEITSLVGNINTMNAEPYTHIHITLAGEGGQLVGGHLLECTISLTAEIFIDIIDGEVDRKKDEKLQINKFAF